MLYKTHLMYSIFISILILKLLKFSNPTLFVIMVIIGTMIVDMDSVKSKVGKKLFFFSIFFEHRGFLHTLFAPLLYFLVLVYLNFDSYLIFGFQLGYISHIMMDCLTVKGIKPIYPISNFKIKGFIKVGSLSEKIIFVILCFSSLFVLLL